MTCIHTGCDVYFPEHGTVSHGDMYKVGEAFVFYGDAPVPCEEGGPLDFFMRIGQEGFYKETSPYHVWVSTYCVKVNPVSGGVY